MTESFADLFEESLKDLDVARGSIIKGTVVSIDSDWVTVNAGLKSEGIIAREEFLSEAGELEIVEGDEVDVAVAVPASLTTLRLGIRVLEGEARLGLPVLGQEREDPAPLAGPLSPVSQKGTSDGETPVPEPGRALRADEVQ